MKRTRWFPCTIKPVRKGWYECRYARGYIGRWYFDRGAWWVSPKNRNEFAKTEFGNVPADLEVEHWRGLTRKVK